MGEYWRPLVDAVEQGAGHRLGRFELEALVGYGGMGVVFRARDPQLDRIVALKLWNLDGDEAEQALLREAKLQAKVTHANVVTIYETGKIGDEVYIAMEYVRGMDARRWMDEYEASWQLTLAMLMHAGRGLAAIHERGLVHADFKPENILVGTDGRVLVADFGVARVLDEHEAEPGAGSSGRGTRAYMAPERLERRRTDARSDQFSFCVTLWECLHGVRPFAGDNAEELLGAMAAGRLRRGRAVPERLEAVLRRGMAVEPDERFGTMEELLRALLRVPVRPVVVEGGSSWAKVGGWVLVGALSASLGMYGWGRIGPQDRAISSDVEKNSADGINPDQATTTKPDPIAEIVAQIERQDFDAAFSRWGKERKASVIAGRDRADHSLTVARAFIKQAKALEASGDGEGALRAARFAMIVAPTVTLTQPHTPEMAADAEQITVDAAAILSKFKDQSKHSTVPSSLE